MRLRSGTPSSSLGRSTAVLRSLLLLACSCALWAAGQSALGPGSASAETFKVECPTEEAPKCTESFEEAVAKADATTGANTIVLQGGVNILPVKTVSFTNKTGVQTIEGPASAPGAKLEGSSVEPFPSELLLVNAGVTLALKNVLVSHAGGEGAPGIEVATEGHLTIEQSGVEGNKAIGMIVQPDATATVTNSTISDQAAGGMVDDGTASFLNSTVAFNSGVGIENKGSLNLTNTIVADNTAENCVGKATTQDHSLDSDGTCGVEKSKVNPLLSELQLNGDGGPVPIHSLEPDSPAIDAGDEKDCPAVDQRGFPRPDEPGTPCDIGADEYSPKPPVIAVPEEIVVPEEELAMAVVNYKEKVAVSDPDGLATVTCSPASGTSFPVGTTTVTCNAIDGHENKATPASFNVKVTPKTSTAPPPTEGTSTAPPAVEPTAPSPGPQAPQPSSPGVSPKSGSAPAAPPAPVLARSLDLAPVTGQVSIRLPGARGFVSLAVARRVPIRTVVETAHGEVSVTAATARGKTEKGDFFDGQFMLTQGRQGRVLATLTGGDFAVCPRTVKAASAQLAQASSGHAVSAQHLVRRLWAEVTGNFGTTGNFATGVVNGAQWLTEDLCDSTLILPTRNRVEITDLVRHRRIEAVAGDIYIAKAG
jgi:HYR domain/Right handed beta helix region